MEPSNSQIYIGQKIFFEMVERSDTNREALSRFALGLSGDDEEYSVRLSYFLRCLPWDEYQAMMSMLGLFAHVAIRWDEFELTQLKVWSAQLAESAANPDHA